MPPGSANVGRISRLGPAATPVLGSPASGTLGPPAAPACNVRSVTAGFVEGVADALVGGTGLAADAVGLDLEQDGDAAARAARDLGSGHVGAQPQGFGGVPQIVGAAG
jgi:hypothetical protein